MQGIFFTPYITDEYNLPMEQSTLTQKGQTTIPYRIRQRLGLKPGDRLVYEERDDEIVLRVQPGLDQVAGMLRGDLPRRSEGDFDDERRTAQRQWAEDGARGLESENA